MRTGSGENQASLGATAAPLDYPLCMTTVPMNALPALQVKVGEMGAVGLVCQENSQSNDERCSCLLLSGEGGKEENTKAVKQ